MRGARRSSSAAPGMHDVEVRVAARAPQHRFTGRAQRRCSARRPTTRRICRSDPGRRTGRRPRGRPAPSSPATRNPPTSPGARSASVGHRMPGRRVGVHSDAGVTSSDSAGITAVGAGSAPAATTSIEEISGAAARTASSTASSSVTADDGQLLQLPENRSRTHARRRSTSSSCDVAAVRAEIGPHAVQRIATRRCTSCGCRPCTSSRLATRSSATNRRPAPRAGRVGAIRISRSRPGAVEVDDLAGPVARRVRVPRRRPPRSRPAVPGSDRPPCATARLLDRPGVPIGTTGHASLPGDRLRRRVQHLQRLAVAEVHVHPARQARIEAAHRAHDVDALEVLPVVLLEDRLPCTASS